jgi:hypothetical protein
MAYGNLQACFILDDKLLQKKKSKAKENTVFKSNSNF